MVKGDILLLQLSSDPHTSSTHTHTHSPGAGNTCWNEDFGSQGLKYQRVCVLNVPIGNKMKQNKTKQIVLVRDELLQNMQTDKNQDINGRITQQRDTCYPCQFAFFMSKYIYYAFTVFCFVLFFFSVLGTEPWISHMLRKCSTIELHSWCI